METSVDIHDFIVDEMLSGIYDRPLTVDDDLIESGIIDSLGIMSLLAFIEERFSLKIPPEDLLPENFSSINSIVALVDRQRRV